MGIDGLLTLLKPLIKKQHISTFKGKTLAIDALPWIYKGVYGANLQIGQTASQKAFLYYILQMIDMLQFYKIKPIFVFDGRSLQAKYKTLQRRKKAKQQQKKKGQQQIQNNQIQKGKKTIARYINIDQTKICLLMKLLTQKKIQFVVAPYEADSQISKLWKRGLVDAVITEDSDLVVYGVDVILKLKQTGQCDYLTLKKSQIQYQNIECTFIKKFIKFDQQKRVQTAILAGCDYVDSVKGIGIKKALKLVQQNQGLQKIVQSINKQSKFTDKVPQDYLSLIKIAKSIFLFAKVYNPILNTLQYLSAQLFQQIGSRIFDKQQDIQSIVGVDYQFKQTHYKGQVNCKTQEERQLTGFNIRQIYFINRQNINFQKQQVKNKQQQARLEQKNNSQQQPTIIDQNISICWQGESCGQGLAFLLQKQLINELFFNNSGGVVQSPERQQ